MNALDFNLRFNAPPGVVFLPFSPEHLIGLALEQPDFANSSPDMLRQRITRQASAGDAITVKKNGVTLGVWGSNQIWPGLEEAWFVVGEACRAYPKSMTRVAKLWLDDRFDSHGVHRVQITTRKNDKRAYNWAKVLGFQDEGVLTHFGWDKSDYYMMAKV